MYFVSDETARKWEEEDSKGCGLIVAKTKDGEVKCGEEMFRKKRHCPYCDEARENKEYEDSQKTSEAKDE